MAGKFLLRTVVLFAILCCLMLVVIIRPRKDLHSSHVGFIVSEEVIKEKRELPQVLRNGGNIEHWLPDWFNQTDMELVLSRRTKFVQERCQTSDHLSRNKWKVYIQRLYAKFSRMTYCATAKAGSTFWRSVIHRMKWMKSEGELEENQHDHPVKLTTVRNPWHRLVSTYQQKIEYITEYRREIRSHCPHRSYKFRKHKPSFREFVKDCVIDGWKEGYVDIHWIPSTERCDICNGRFDYIVAVENMQKEAAHVLKMSGVENADQVLHQVRSNTIRSIEKVGLSANYQDYYRTLDSSDIDILRNIYSRDIYILRYPHSPFVDFEKA